MGLQNLLKEFYFFKQFTQEELKAIETISEKVPVPANQVVFKEGDEASAMFLVESGAVKILRRESSGVIARIGKGGGPFGEMPFLDGGRRSATVMTVEETVLIKIPYTRLATVLLNHPETALKFYEVAAKVISHRLRLTLEDLEQAKTISKSF